jgi:hypothetical protein
MQSEDNMDPAKVAARFVAFYCCLNQEECVSPDRAGDFARKNWQRFLPYVRKEWGQFLTSPSRAKKMEVWKKAKVRPALASANAR